MDAIKTLTAGFVAIGLVTAFGLHATGLSKLAKSGGAATSNVFKSVEKP